MVGGCGFVVGSFFFFFRKSSSRITCCELYPGNRRNLTLTIRIRDCFSPPTRATPSPRQDPTTNFNLAPIFQSSKNITTNDINRNPVTPNPPLPPDKHYETQHKKWVVFTPTERVSPRPRSRTRGLPPAGLLSPPRERRRDKDKDKERENIN